MTLPAQHQVWACVRAVVAVVALFAVAMLAAWWLVNVIWFLSVPLR
jgi:hypothetical protein